MELPYALVNHPLIILIEACLTMVAFWFFFLVKDRPSPVPQLYGLLPFTLLTNLTARLIGVGWFYISDIALFVMLFACFLASAFSVHYQERSARLIATQEKKPLPLPDIFDRWQVKILWSAGVLLVGVLAYGYVTAFQREQQARTNATVAATRENTRVTAEYTRQQYEDSQERDSILTAVSSLSAVQEAIQSGVASVSATQQTLMAGQQKLSRQVAQTSAVAGATASKVDTTKNDVKTIKKALTNEKSTEKSDKKPGLFKRIFGYRSVADSLQHVRADDQVRPASDTLVFH